jgi:electron transfer flavoprotein beta subunit
VGEVKILVCIKQVPDAEAPVRIGAEGRSLVVGEGAWRMNRFDEFAVEEALRIRETFPGTRVEVLSVGPPRAAEVLRRALAMGADEALHILREEEEDPFPGDVAAWVAACIHGRGHDLILTGVMSEDAMQAQTGPILAELLGIPCATAVIAVRLCPEAGAPREENGTPPEKREIGVGRRPRDAECACPQPGVIRVERELEGGLREALEMPLPALITVQSGINRPRYPALSHVLRARSQPLLTLRADELPDPPRRERVVRIAWTEPSGKALFLTGTPAEKAERLAALFREKALL